MPDKKVIVIGLGGTIAAAVSADARGARLTLTAEDLVGGLGSIGDDVVVESLGFRQVISAELTLADVVQLAREIDRLAAAGVAGFVVTQGTDTLEETAFLLDRLVDTSAPVVVTGAMRNPGMPGADGPANLVASIRVAASPLAVGIGTVVVLDDEIHAARFVRKTHTSSTGTFRSSPLGPVGWVTEGRVRIPLVPRARTRRIDATRLGDVVPRVELVRLALGDDGWLVETAAAAEDLAGLVVEVYGAGHVSRHVLDPLVRLATRIPVVFASRTGSGELYAASGDFPGSERDLLGGGLISAVSLDGLKARLLLMLLLASGVDKEEISRAFAESAL